MSKTSSLLVTAPPVAVARDIPHRARLGEIYKGDVYEVTSEIDFAPNTEVDEAVRRAAMKPLPTGKLKDAWRHLHRRNKFIVIFTWATFIFLALFAFFLGQFLPFQTSWLRKYVVDSPPEGLAPTVPGFEPRSWPQGAERSFTSTSTVAGIPLRASEVAPSSVSGPATTTVMTSSQSAPAGTSNPKSTMRRVPVYFHA